MSLRSSISQHIKRFERQLVTYNHIYISRSAILDNFDLFAKLSPGGVVFPVLKSNAYGHGLKEVTSILKARKFPYIAVDGYFESLRVHEVSRQPVLVMGAIHPDNFKSMSFKKNAFVVQDRTTIEALAKTGRRVKVHLELETGMGRHGIALEDLAGYLVLLKKYPKIVLEGVMTHLADADNPKTDSYVVQQAQKFDTAVKQVLAAGFTPKYIHIAQSAGSAKAGSEYANAIRPGIALYGISPLEKADAAAGKLGGLKPALTLTSTITKVFTAKPGDTISYGRIFTAKRPSRIGVLPLGYYEGVPRALSNTGVVKLKESYLPITGRVCMNHTMVDVTDSKVKVGDEVVVISPEKADKNSVQTICDEHDLFNYSFITGLNQNIRRTIKD